MIPVPLITYEWLCKVYGESFASKFWHPDRVYKGRQT